MSRPDASARLDDEQRRPVAGRRTRDRSPVGRWWWFQVGIICLLICCVVALMIFLLIPPLTVNPGGLPTVTGNTPSAGAQQPLTGATLGGTLASFDAAYGAPLRTSGVGARWESATIAGQKVALTIAFADGQDGQPHVAGISASPAANTDAGWDDATAQHVMAVLAPGDGRLIKTDTRNPDALTQVYMSAELGVTFTSGQFENGGNTPFPAGEFSVGCQRNSSGRVTACSMSPGAP